MRMVRVRGDSSEQIDLVPSKIIGIGVNDRAHAVEVERGYRRNL